MGKYNKMLNKKMNFFEKRKQVMMENIDESKESALKEKLKKKLKINKVKD